NANLVGTIPEVDGWLQTLLGNQANDVASKLGAMARDGAAYEDMVSAAGGILDGAESRSISTAVDLLTSRAMSRGALALYKADGLQYVNFLTAGDGQDCPICSSLEARNPYKLEDAPLSGQHPYCRCTLSPARHPANTVMFQPGQDTATRAASKAG